MNKLFHVYFLSILFFSFTNLYSKEYKGAEVRTNESYLYGKFEVKMKSSQASGMLCSFFTFYDAKDFVTNWNEIDIEILGRYTNEVQFNAIVGKHEMHEHRHILNFNPHETFHIYAFEWTPESIIWYVDGQEVYKQTGEHVKAMNKPQKIMMNIWSSSFWGWTGPWEDPVLPIKASYDYVSYYKYTPEKKDKFSLSWTDEFDSFDPGRWSKASHTFDGNTCDLSPENVEVKEGILNLTLSNTEVEMGEIEDLSPPVDYISSARIVTSETIVIKFNKDIYRPAANKKNFLIDGVSILKSKLKSDLRTVELLVEKIDPEKEYKLFYFTPDGKKEEINIGVKH